MLYIFNIYKIKEEKTTTAGFEPARAKPNRFLVCLLNHSDKLSCYNLLTIHISNKQGYNFKFFRNFAKPDFSIPLLTHYQRSYFSFSSLHLRLHLLPTFLDQPAGSTLAHGRTPDSDTQRIPRPALLPIHSLSDLAPTSHAKYTSAVGTILRLRSVAFGSNLHHTAWTAVPFFRRCSEEIKRQALRSADENHADDPHDIGDGFPGRKVRLDHRGVWEVHPHRGSPVHALSLERLELPLCARFELRVALRRSLFALQNLRNQPRILHRIGRTRAAGRTGGVGRVGRGVRAIGQMHHLGLHVRPEIARIHSVLTAEHQQAALRNLALELLHPRLQLPHAHLRRLRPLRPLHRRQQHRLRRVERLARSLRRFRRPGGLRRRGIGGRSRRGVGGEDVENALEQIDVEERVGKDEARTFLGGGGAEAELREDLDDGPERGAALLEGIAGGVERAERGGGGVADLMREGGGGGRLRCCGGCGREGRRRDRATTRSTASAAARARCGFALNGSPESRPSGRPSPG